MSRPPCALDDERVLEHLRACRECGEQIVLLGPHRQAYIAEDDFLPCPEGREIVARVDGEPHHPLWQRMDL